MSELKELFDRRDNEHKKATKIIFKSLQNVVEGISEFIGANEEEEEPVGHFSWDDVVYLFNEVSLETNGLVLLMGSLSYSIGSKVPMPNGEIVEINEETVEYFKRIIRIGVPFTLAETGTKEEVVEFLQSSVQQEEGPAEETEMDISDFLVEDLTEEQQQALKMFSHLSGDKTN